MSSHDSAPKAPVTAIAHQHPNLARHPAFAEGQPMAALLAGTWRGEGKGEYPTIQPFPYTEELKSAHPAQPFLHFEMRTWLPDKNNRPAHAENGFLRVMVPKPAQPDAEMPRLEGTEPVRMELLATAPNGLASIEEGIFNPNDNSITFKSTGLSRSSTSRPPFTVAFNRTFRLSHGAPGDGARLPDQLEYTMAMATSTTPEMTHHLSAKLKRVE
ncbi:DUF1794-domain-containing protein [Gonapodya prolifera JEL478]|uniref:DUF1794-domain-containing protein n=1 Tax=Gonapodya prolifera (strain JEL478) TaxID=1344416 RepID=A0A139A9V4_GONPJ|nr:DUF1794-domain-containing protein [Gonapodya prolifera JEL478]|eukprot:KXS13468.1 DUF1794-domain-containing protein [Gonapodya prolifera JEL478]